MSPTEPGDFRPPSHQHTERWTPTRGVRWRFDVDVVGGCNLRCPSCPVGNMREVKNPTGVMAPGMMTDIVDKALRECGKADFFLYSWTEPLLHPQIGEMIRIVRSAGARCGLSTNLNIIKNLENALAAEPNALKVSLSGFRQESYGVTHERGNIENVKANMAALAAMKERLGSRTRIQVPFHRYLGNHEDEQQMRRLCESLGFEFQPAWAYLMPLEKVLAFIDPQLSETAINEEDRNLVSRLALPLEDAIRVARSAAPRPCVLRDRQMSITVTGEVMLCCATYDQSRYGLGSYLQLPLGEIQQRKYRHYQCGPCMESGLHVLFTYGSPELDKVALDNVQRHFPGVKLPVGQELRPRKSLSERIRKEGRRMIDRLQRITGRA